MFQSLTTTFRRLYTVQGVYEHYWTTSQSIAVSLVMYQAFTYNYLLKVILLYMYRVCLWVGWMRANDAAYDAFSKRYPLCIRGCYMSLHECALLVLLVALVLFSVKIGYL
jgi:hypothetical protein